VVVAVVAAIHIYRRYDRVRTTQIVFLLVELYHLGRKFLVFFLV